MYSRQINTDFNGFRQLIKNGQLFQQPRLDPPQQECTMRLRLLCSEEMISQDKPSLSTTGVWQQFPLSQLRNRWVPNSLFEVKQTIVQNSYSTTNMCCQQQESHFKEEMDSQMIIMNNDDDKCSQKSKRSDVNIKNGKTAKLKKNQRNKHHQVKNKSPLTRR